MLFFLQADGDESDVDGVPRPVGRRESWEKVVDGYESDVDGARESSKNGCKTLKNDNQEILIHR